MWYNSSMKKQMLMPQLADPFASSPTHRRSFLKTVDRALPWSDWAAEIRPRYYKGERGKKPYDLELMLRIYLLQLIFGWSSRATADELLDSRACADFCGVDSPAQVPSETTIRRFRALMKRIGMEEGMIEAAQGIKHP